MKKRYNPYKRKSHNWNYYNNVVYDNGRNFKIYQSKGRNRPSPKGSGVPLKSRFKWKFNGIQTYKRIGNKYLITLKGNKTLLNYKLGRRRDW